MKSIILLMLLPFSLFASSDLEMLQAISQERYPYALPKLPYPYESLEPTLDTETMHLHHDKHHANYVDNLNKALANPDLVFEQSWTLNELIERGMRLPAPVHNNAGGHWNHSFFWIMMTPDASKHVIPTRLEKALETSFGSIIRFKELFKQAGLARLGSGWDWLIMKPDGTLDIVSTANQDNPMMHGVESPGVPLLTCDVWEHAYYLKYKNRRDDFLSHYWDVVNWKFVDELYGIALQNSQKKI